jgi:hypothetical protein
MKRKSVLIILGLTMLLLVISCQKNGPEWKGMIEEIGGLVVVNNPDVPIYDSDVFRLEEELCIGESSSDDYMFSEIVGIAVDGLSNIFVLDFKEANVKVFNDEGYYIRTTSKKGEGPGELSMPYTISITSGNELMIQDVMNRRLSFFSFEGEFLKHIPTAKVNLGRCCLDPEGHIIGIIFGGDENQIQYNVKELDPDCQVLKTFISTPPLKRGLVRPFVARPIFTFSSKFDIIFAYPDDYVIHIFDNDGNEIRRIHKEYKPVTVFQEHIDEMKETFKKLPDNMKLEMASHYPAFLHLSIDEEGRIFVNTFENLDLENEIAPIFEVFDHDGRYIAKIEIPAQPVVWKGGKLYTIEEDEEGFQVVKKYKVTWHY